MRIFLLLLLCAFIALSLSVLKSCYYEIYDPLNCEKVYPMAKGSDYYSCVKARAFQNREPTANDLP